MLDNLLGSVLTTSNEGAATAVSFLICTAGSLVLGLAVAGIHMFRNTYSKNFVVTLALLPAIIQVVIMMVNGNVGTGVAVMGAFSLVRFRSIPGSAKEIGSIFLAMAVGLATGMGYIGFAAVFVVIYGAATIAYTVTKFGEAKMVEKELKVTIPESLDCEGLLDDLFAAYTTKSELVRIRTTNMGSLYQLSYSIQLKPGAQVKEFLDAIRCRNGNLDITLGRVSTEKMEL